MKQPYVIAFTGKKGSGKTMAAQAIVDHDTRFVISPLGHSLKKAVRALFGWSPRHTDGDLKDIVDPVYGITPRAVMQLIGDDVMRGIFPKASDGFRQKVGRLFWVKKVLARAEEADVKFIVIPDLRDPSDYAYLKTHTNLMVINIHRPALDNENDSHSSERGYLNIPADYTLVNEQEGNTWPFRAGVINIYLQSRFAQGTEAI